MSRFLSEKAGGVLLTMAVNEENPLTAPVAEQPKTKPRAMPDKKWLVLATIALLLAFTAGSRYGQYLVFSAADEAALVADAGAAGDTPAATDTAPAAEIAVHVKGAVEQPGLYRFSAGARVDDAVLAAAALPEADLDRLNLAAYLSDGGQLIVPYAAAAAQDSALADQATQTEALLAQTGNPGEEAVIGAAAESAATDAAGGKININTASVEELQALSGIGETKAKAIVNYREQNGAFAYPEQIKRVSGIGDALYLTIAGDICVE